MNIDAIAVGQTPLDDVNIFVEVLLGGEPIKYEMDKVSGTLFVIRFFYTPMRNSGDYSVVPHMLSDDGDPIDVLIAYAPDHSGRHHQCAADRRPEDGG